MCQANSPLFYLLVYNVTQKTQVWSPSYCVTCIIWCISHCVTHVIWPRSPAWLPSRSFVPPVAHLRDLHHVIPVTSVTCVIWSRSPVWLTSCDPNHLRDLRHMISVTCVTCTIWSASPAWFASCDGAHLRDLCHMICVTLRDADHMTDTTYGSYPSHTFWDSAHIAQVKSCLPLHQLARTDMKFCWKFKPIFLAKTPPWFHCPKAFYITHNTKIDP